jgi:hypothetical protein
MLEIAALGMIVVINAEGAHPMYKQFPTMEECHQAAHEVMPELVARPEVLGVYYSCTPVGVPS